MITRIKDYFWTKKTVKLIKKHGFQAEVDGKRGKAIVDNTHDGKMTGWFMPADGSYYLTCIWVDALELKFDNDGRPFIKVYLV